jgi:hypothetical protein
MSALLRALLWPLRLLLPSRLIHRARYTRLRIPARAADTHAVIEMRARRIGPTRSFPAGAAVARSSSGRRRRPARRGLAPKLLVLAGLAALALSLAAVAFAYFTAGATGGSNGQSTAGTVGPPGSPTVAAFSTTGTVHISWGAAKLGNGDPVQGYFVTRSDNAAVCGSSIGSPITGLSCDDSGVPDGTYSYTVFAVFHNWTTPAATGSILVDTQAPAPTVTAPADGSTNVSTTPTITGTAGTQPADSTHSADNGTVDVAIYAGGTPTGAPVRSFTGVAATGGTWTVNVLTALAGGTTYTVKVTQGDAAGNSGSSSSSFTTTSTAAKLAIITAPRMITAGDVTGTITVQRQDASGNPAVTGSSITVDLSSSSGAGAFEDPSNAPITSVTIAAGASTASFLYTDTVAGSPVITAADDDHVLTSATQAETVVPAAANKLAFTVSPGDTSADNPLAPQPQVTVEDQYGNTVTGDSSAIAIAIKSGTGSLGASLGGCGSNPKNASSGIATFAGCQITLVGAGYVLRATDPGLIGADSSAFDITPGAAGAVAITPTPSSATASSTTNISLAFQLQDQFGNNTTSSGTTTLSLSAVSSAGFFGASNGAAGTATASVTFGNGVGTATEYYGDQDASASTLITAKNLTTSWGTTHVQIDPGTASRLAVTAPSTTTAGSPVTVTVTAQDQFGNTATSYHGTAHFTSSDGGAAVGLPASYQFVAGDAGVHTFTNGVKLVTAGSQTVTATDTADGSITGAASIVVTAGSATNLAVSAGNGQSATVNTAFSSPLVAKVTDSFGNVVSGVSVAFTAPGSAATAAFKATGGACASGGSAQAACTATSNASGLATSSAFTASTTAGTYTVMAASAGLTGSPLSFTETNTAGTATTIAISSGSGQSAKVNTAFTNPMVAKVTDTFGNAVAGVSVTFTAPGSGAGGTFKANAGACVPGGSAAATCTTATDASGLATSSTFTANATTGGYNVTVTSAGLTGSPLTFSETNTAGAATTVAFSVQPSGATSANGVFPIQPSVTVTDSLGNPVSGQSVTLTTNGVANGSLAGCLGAVNTNASGVATFSGCTWTAVGTADTIKATSGALSAVSASFNITGPKKLVFSAQPSTTATAGSAFAAQPTVSVEDAAGNIVTADSSNVTLAITTPNGATLSCTTGLTSAASYGVVPFTGCSIDNPSATAYRLKATDGSLTVTTSTGITVSAGQATQIVLSSSGTDLGAGAGETVTATIEDALGNTVTTGADSSRTITFAQTAGPGSVSGLTSAAAVAGVKTITITGGALGSVTLRASATLTQGATNSNTLTFNVNAAPTISSPTAASPCNPGHNGTADCTISGTGFESGATATISDNGNVNSVTFNSATQLTINVTGNGGQRKPGDITVTNPDGGSVTVKDGFSNG